MMIFVISMKCSTESIPWDRDPEEIEETERMVIVCRWSGLEGIPAVQNETLGFELALDSTVSIDRYLEVPIVSPHGVAWRDLGKLDIRIMRIGARCSQEMDQDDDRTEITAKTAPGATTILAGALCMSDMIPTQKGSSSSRPNAASIKLAPKDRAVAEARLDVNIRLLRRPQSSGWQKIMYTVSSKGASPFFERRLDSILEKVQRNDANFSQFICAKRLQNLKGNKAFSSWIQGARHSYQQ